MTMIWIVIAIAAVIIELLTPTALVCIWFACGGVVAALLSFLGIDITYQIVVFIAISLITMIIVRPIATRYLRGNTIATNADRFIGEVGSVTRSIVDGAWGEVYIKSTYWSAVEVNGNDINKGKKVKVIAIEGAKLIVKEIN